MTIYQDVFANSTQPGNVLVGAISAVATQIVPSSLIGFPAIASGQVARIAIQDTPTSPIEIVWATGQSGNTFTVLRGMEGSTATAHVQGAAVAQVITAGVMNNLYPTVVDQTANGNFTWPLTSAGIPAQKVILNQASPQAANVSINPALFIPGLDYTLTDGGNNGQGICESYVIQLVPTSGLIRGVSEYQLTSNGQSITFYTDNNQANFWIK